MNLLVKEFWKSVDICKVMGKSRVSCFFLSHGYIAHILCILTKFSLPLSLQTCIIWSVFRHSTCCPSIIVSYSVQQPRLSSSLIITLLCGISFPTHYQPVATHSPLLSVRFTRASLSFSLSVSYHFNSSTSPPITFSLPPFTAPRLPVGT